MLDWIKSLIQSSGKNGHSTPKDTVIYAIGDIHGRYDLLQRLHNLISLDVILVPSNYRKVIVYMGDYVDRGPGSKQVIDCLLGTGPSGFERVFLKGNHEYAMLKFLQDPTIGETWLAWGGYATIQSYGVKLVDMFGRKQKMDKINHLFKEALPQEHIDFLKSLQICHVEGDYVFVHAGIKPFVELSSQSHEDMMMIREEFIYSDYPIPDKTVVFGHTIFDEPFVKGGKIAIDTGAYATGKLTAAVLCNDSIKFIST